VLSELFEVSDCALIHADSNLMLKPADIRVFLFLRKTITGHPHLNLPHQWEGIQWDNEYSPPLVGRVRGGVNCYENPYSFLIFITFPNTFSALCMSPIALL
jgi:hypothetical protein